MSPVGAAPSRIAGYASVFDVADAGADVVRRGAFARAVAGAGLVPLLWAHDAARPIGRVEMLAEDARGLRVIARLSATAAGRAAGAALADGRVRGLSFGYRVRGARVVGGGVRELVDVELIEVSVVGAPMQPLARVHAVE